MTATVEQSNTLEMDSSAATSGTGTRVRHHPVLSLHRIALAGIVLLSAVLNFVALGSEGYANTYYAAAVKSMMKNWHNFFFVSFDPGGFVAVDKPPLGLWLQTASAKLFGFDGVSLLVPQGLAAILSVIVLCSLISRRFGSAAGLLAAATMAVTPVAVVDNRNNTSDSVLVFVLLLSVWAVTRAVETSRLRWLLLGGFLMGLAFNVKEMEAYLVLPPLFLLYVAGSRQRFASRLWHLVLFGIVTLIVSFAWIVAVDLTPAGSRPYVSDSGTNSELSLALGYNGFGRLATGLLSRLPSIPFLHVKIDGSIVPGISADIGNPGVFRLFRPAIGGQASWLLLVALVGLIAAALLPRSRSNVRIERSALLFWGSWLLAAVAFFSVARFYHLYYLIMLAPPVSALTGIGLARMWDDYRTSITTPSRSWQGWMLPFTLLAGGLAQAEILSGYSSWNSWIGPVIAVLGTLAALALVLGRLGIRFALATDFTLHFDPRATLAATLVGTGALLTAPTAFAADSVANGNGAAWLPQAGPSTGFGFGSGFAGGPGSRPPGGFRFSPSGSRSGFTPPSFAPGAAGPTGARTPSGVPGGQNNRRFSGPGGFGGGGALTFAGNTIPSLNAGLLNYLEKHRGHTRYLVATATSNYASLFILKTGQPVMALGGYQGWDKILTLTQLKQQVASGTIRFFLLSGSGGSFGPAGGAFSNGVDAGLNAVNDRLTSWVASACTAIPAKTYTTATRVASTSPTTGAVGRFGDQGPGQLYDCRSAS